MRRTFYVAIAMVALGMPQARAAADLVLFLQQVSRVGPTQFVRWADGYYAERKEGKSGFQGSDAQLGSVTGAIMGGALGMLKDDMFSGIKQGAESGKDTGGKLGNAYGVVQGQSQALEDLITDYVNDRQPLLDKVEQMVDTCLQTGQPFSTCRTLRRPSQHKQAVTICLGFKVSPPRATDKPSGPSHVVNSF